MVDVAKLEKKVWIQPTEFIAQNQDSLNKHEAPFFRLSEPPLNSPEMAWIQSL